MTYKIDLQPSHFFNVPVYLGFKSMSLYLHIPPDSNKFPQV